MSPFRFRLERLRRVRASEERAARAHFAATTADFNSAEDRVRVTSQARVAARAELRHILSNGGSAASFVTAQRVTDRYDALVVDAQCTATEAAAARDSARADWIATRAKHEGLTRLRSARKSEHRREYERFLARELDEVAIARAAGKSNLFHNPSTPTQQAS